MNKIKYKLYLVKNILSKIVVYDLFKIKFSSLQFVLIYIKAM
jgi:hypothetical protein